MQNKTSPPTASRRADGRPETAADTRFFDLRAAGYTGPVDQDGYPVNDPETVGIFTSLARATERQMAARDAEDDDGTGS